MSKSNYHFSVTKEIEIHFDQGEPIIVTGIVSKGSLLFDVAKYAAFKIKNNGLSISWEQQFNQSIRLLLDYSIANAGYFKNPKEMFENFAYRLEKGTINKSGYDPTCLRWEPRSVGSYNRMITHITNFSDWLYDEKGGKSALLNPMKEASSAEKIINLAAFNHRKNNSFLKHTYSDDQKNEAVNHARNVSRRQDNSLANTEPKKSFPEDKFWDLLFIGFKKKTATENTPFHEAYRIDYMLITMLMHLGGLRKSEPFHLFIDDIIPNKEGQNIKVYDPQIGLAPAFARLKYGDQHLTRSQFLAKEYGMTDRKTAKGPYHAGFKDSALIDKGKYFEVFFFGYPELQKFFYELFRLYLTTRVQPLSSNDHRYLFTGPDGSPLKLGTFDKAHQSAVRKIGLEPLLDHGGAEHCHRHAYGKRLAGVKVDPLFIKGAMHHKSLDSQKIYTQPLLAEIASALKTGAEALEGIGKSSNKVPLLPEVQL